MKFFADNLTTFTGPHRADRAAEFVAELPEGAATHLGNGVVKMLRTVRPTGWVLDAAEPAPRRRALAALVLSLFVVCLALLSPAVAEGAGGLPSALVLDSMILGRINGPAAAILPLGDVTLSETKIGMAALAFISVLIGYHFVISKYIREQAGVKDSQDVTINNQPVQVEGKMETNKAPRWATWDEVEVLRKDLTLLRSESAKRDSGMRDFVDEKFHTLSRERSVSIARLHERLEAASNGLRQEIDTKVDGVRSEIHDMPGKLVTLLKETGAIGGKSSR